MLAYSVQVAVSTTFLPENIPYLLYFTCLPSAWKIRLFRWAVLRILAHITTVAVL
jgi:hypothetical protein